MFNKQTYVKGLVVMTLSLPCHGTNFKFADRNIHADHEIGVSKLVHHNKNGFVVYAKGEKIPIANHNLSSELRSITNKQLSAYQKAAFFTLRKSQDGELTLTSDVRGSGGMMGNKGSHKIATPLGENIGFWIGKGATYLTVGWLVNKTVERTQPTYVMDGVTIRQEGKHIIQQSIEEGGIKGGVAYVAKEGAKFALASEATACAAVAVTGVEIASITPAPVGSFNSAEFVALNAPPPCIFQQTNQAFAAAAAGNAKPMAALVVTSQAGPLVLEHGVGAAKAVAGEYRTAQFTAKMAPTMNQVSEATQAYGGVAVGAAATGGVSGIETLANGVGTICGKILGLFI